MREPAIFFIGTILSLSANAQNLAGEPKGIYGGDGKNAPSLQLNEDHTFIYTDLTNKIKPVVAEGIWSIKSDKLILQSRSGANLDKRYTVIRGGMCIKTRKNFAFYTLCNCKY